MAFSEALKKEVRKKSDGHCAVCHKPIVEIHHIKPQAENGEDTFDNAIALCAGCHDLYGDSPSKRKQLKEMRDNWYEEVEKRKQPKIVEKYKVVKKIKLVSKSKDTNEKCVAIYHEVKKEEDFQKAVEDLLALTKEAQKNFPKKNRILYLDIDGHRDDKGDFDQDMQELQLNFLFKNLLMYYKEAYLPLCHIKNKYEQLNDQLPDQIKYLIKTILLKN